MEVISKYDLLQQGSRFSPQMLHFGTIAERLIYSYLTFKGLLGFFSLLHLWGELSSEHTAEKMAGWDKIGLQTQ